MRCKFKQNRENYKNAVCLKGIYESVTKKKMKNQFKRNNKANKELKTCCFMPFCRRAAIYL
jgi:hypothetical protein